MPRQRANYRRRTYDFPQRLVRFKEESGFSWAEMNRRLGTDPHTIRRWRDKGMRPSTRHMIALVARADSGLGRTKEDGSFAMPVPDGSFTLQVFAPGEGCTFVGWYGPGGFTTVREDATRIEVDGESLIDIVIRLPDHPDALPRTEHCA